MSLFFISLIFFDSDEFLMHKPNQLETKSGIVTASSAFSHLAAEPMAFQSI